jgi:hypothetical protein
LFVTTGHKLDLLRHDEVVRTRLVLGIVAVVVLIPQAAHALCVVEPFDRVVRSSDAVLVATVADAQAVPHQSEIILRLDVEQTLKGSAANGQQVRVGSCGAAIVGPGATNFARQMIGKRGLYLLSKSPDGTFFQYSDVLTPPMTLDEEIARAHQVLGLSQGIIPTAQPESGRSIVTVVLIVLGVGVLIAGVVLFARRAARS